MATCSRTASETISNGSSAFHFHSVATGFLWCRQQKTHLLAQARDGVASMHWYLRRPPVSAAYPRRGRGVAAISSEARPRGERYDVMP